LFCYQIHGLRPETVLIFLVAHFLKNPVDLIRTKLTEEIHFYILKFTPMAILAKALLQQHDARRDILIERAACCDQSSGAFGTGGAIGP